MRGRKAEIRAVDGALRTVPSAPKWLPEHGKAAWKIVMAQLVADGKIAKHELSVVEGYCVATARVREAEEIVQREGMTYVSPSGDIKRRPETMILKESIEAQRRLAAELGLTPASREKNKGGAPNDGNASEFGVDI